MNNKTILIAILVMGWMLHSQWSNAWVDYDRSVVINQIPDQLEPSKAPFTVKEFTITPMAEFDIKARVLSRKNYFLGTEAKLSPVDFALGWGPMSNYHVLKDLKISQRHRWYFYRYKEAPIMPAEIVRHSANMHLLPADKDVRRKLKGVRRGAVVRIKGYLVNVRKADGWHWNTSLSRRDSGSGACEIIWVEDIEIVS
ncbi:MAG: hypothetical protein K8I00_03400 [Candidatus Omnitrophica bacterium]|nr:hypothetical protein [Candidatus Omnitrophota bacterium]